MPGKIDLSSFGGSPYLSEALEKLKVGRVYLFSISSYNVKKIDLTPQTDLFQLQIIKQ